MVPGSAQRDIPVFDEIVQQLGPPAAVRILGSETDVVAVAARFRHRGASLRLSASNCFRIIFHVSSSSVRVPDSSGERVQAAGSVVTSVTQSPELLDISGPADTFHFLFKPGRIQHHGPARILPGQVLSALRAAAVRAIAGMHGDDAQDHLQQSFEQITLSLASCHSLPTAGGLSPSARARVMRLLETPGPLEFRVPALAEAAGLSLHHFIRAFCQAEGCTPHRYLLERRIERSLPLLLQPDVRLEEVALRTGFCSASHFIGSFRRVTGVTPAAYRSGATR